MPCYHPFSGYRHSVTGRVKLHRPHSDELDAPRLDLPCGSCTGCKADLAISWQLRCWLESHRHLHQSFATLTYDEESLPWGDHGPTLYLRDLQLFFKRLRKRLRVRYFACGEYGDTTQRPHYHALLFGVSESDKGLVEHTWGNGRVDLGTVTPASVAYVTGYTLKKLGSVHGSNDLREPPFRVMSRNPGIGSHAHSYGEAWAQFGVLPGNRRVPSPRYFKAHLKKRAETDPVLAQRLETYELLQSQYLSTLPLHTAESRSASEELALARRKLAAERRDKL